MTTRKFACIGFAVACAGLAVSASAKKLINHAGRSERFRASHAQRLASTPAQTSIIVPDGLTGQVRELQGYAMAPVPLNLDGKDPALVGLGSYLVNVSASCSDCHSNPLFLPDGDPFRGMPAKINAAGYMGGGNVFGPFTSRNLTPEPANGNKPAGMDLDEFMHVMRTGEDTDKLHPEFGPLLQVMPWPAYRGMTDRELAAIYEYLRSIPAVKIEGVQ